MDDSKDLRVRKQRTSLRTRDEQLEAAKAFGRELTRRRLNRGIRFTVELAEITGISRSYLSVLELGYRKTDNRPVFASPEKMMALSKALDWPVAEMQVVLGQAEPQDTIFSGRSDETIRDEFMKLSPEERMRVLGELMAAVTPEEAKKRDAHKTVGRQSRQTGGEQPMTEQEAEQVCSRYDGGFDSVPKGRFN